MKNVMTVVLMMIGIITYAQEVKPELKKLENGTIEATFFHDNGAVAQKGFFLNNKRHGEWLSYDQKGQKTAQAEFENGQKTGKWFIWEGNKLTEVDYRDNQIAAVNTWVSKNPVASNQP